MGADEKKIFKASACVLLSLSVYCWPKSSLKDGADTLDFLVTLLNVAIVLDATENNSAFNGDESGYVCGDSNFLPGTVGKGIEPPLINALGDETTYRRVHPARLAKKEPVVGRDDGVKHGCIRPTGLCIFESVLQRGKPGVPRMRALHGLFQLHLIAKKNEILRTASHGHGVRQRNLAGFVDKKEIEHTFPFRAREKPRRSTDNAAGICGGCGGGGFDVTQIQILGKDRPGRFTANFDSRQVLTSSRAALPQAMSKLITAL